MGKNRNDTLNPDINVLAEGELPSLPSTPGFAQAEVEAKPLPEKYKGQKSYELSDKMYRDGEMYQPGERLNVTDEVPGLSWKPLPYDAALRDVTRLKAPLAKQAPTTAALTEPSGGPSRASDRDL